MNIFATHEGMYDALAKALASVNNTHELSDRSKEQEQDFAVAQQAHTGKSKLRNNR